MADPEALAALEGDIQKAQEAVGYQGDSVRSLKASAKEGKADKVRGCLGCARVSSTARVRGLDGSDRAAARSETRCC